MQKIIILFVLAGIFAITTNYAYSQEVKLATFQETSQVIIDKSRTQDALRLQLPYRVPAFKK